MVYGTTNDHVTLVVTMTELVTGKKQFRYYNSWLNIDSFNSVYEEAWKTNHGDNPLFNLQQKHENSKIAARTWAQEFGNPQVYQEGGG